MNLSFMFWNVRGGTRSLLLDCLGNFGSQGIDIFMIAEGPDETNGLLTSLNSKTKTPYAHVPSINPRVGFFSRLKDVAWLDRSLSPSHRVSVLELHPRSTQPLILVGAHLHAANHLSIDDRAEWARDIAADIRQLEGDAGHFRSILVGDLNMNPFDGGLIQTTALNAVMTRELAKSVPSMKARENYPAFYNPMWSFLGDLPVQAGLPLSGARRAPGTFFYSNSGARTNPFWQMYDQLLLRPCLADGLRRLEITVTDGVNELTTSAGRPRSDAISDHLPLYFELSI